MDSLVGRGIQLLLALEEGDGDDKDVLYGLAADFLDELSGGASRSTGSDEVVYDDDICGPAARSCDWARGHLEDGLGDASVEDRQLS